MPTTISGFVGAGLVDRLARRGRVAKDYEVEAASAPSGLTHVTFTRASE